VAQRNPYHYGTPVSGAQFAGREQETAALVQRMSDGINVVLVSPRRYGKTSLLVRAATTLTKQGGLVARVNVLRCADQAALAAQLTSAVYELPGARWHRLRQAVPEFVRRLRITPSVTFDGDRPRFSFEPSLSAADTDRVVADVYAALAEHPPKKSAALVLDEFQAIVDIGRHLPALLKALADEHPSVSLVLSGSKQHPMRRLVVDAKAPLYGTAEHFALDVLPPDVMASYLRRRARSAGKPMSAQAAAEIIAAAGPVPNDIQHLAYEVFDAAAERIRPADVRAGIARAVDHEASLHAERFETLAPCQRRVLTELARRPISAPQAADFVRRASLANASSVRRALDALRGEELVVRRDGTYQVADPFFAAWLRQ
jgi:hypothetical protein